LRRNCDSKASLEDVRNRNVIRVVALADYGLAVDASVTYTEFPLRNQSDTIWQTDINL